MSDNFKKDGEHGGSNVFTLNLQDLPAAPSTEDQGATVSHAARGAGPMADTVAGADLGFGEPTVTGAEDTVTGFFPGHDHSEDPTLALASERPELAAEDYQGEHLAGSADDVIFVDQPARSYPVIRTLGLAIAAAAVVFFGLLFYEAVESGEDPVTYVFSSLGIGGGSRGSAGSIVPDKSAGIARVEPVVSKPSIDPNTIHSNLSNPYWNLPNPAPEPASGSSRSWSTAERIIWKGGIEHKFPYQRFKTIQQIREFRMPGSEEILWRGLKEEKFWSRMSAAMGLAEFGVPVDVDLVEQVIGEARPSLVSNYFKRFRRQRSDGELYVLRQALKVVDAEARLVIHQVISGSADALRDVYLVAGTFDPGPGIAAFTQSQLNVAGIAKERQVGLRNYIEGKGSLPETLPVNEPSNDGGNDVAPSDTIETVDKIEFYGEVKSAPLEAAGPNDEAGAVTTIEIGDEDIL